MPDPLPPWPAVAPAHGDILLRALADRDVPMLCDLATDEYLAQIGSLPYRATSEQALAFLHRQHGRQAEGAGYSFCIARTLDDIAVGTAGLWLRRLGEGIGSIGYAVAPAHRGRGNAAAAVAALCALARTIPGLIELEAFIEPWNIGSRRAVGRSAFVAGALSPHPRANGTDPVPMIRHSLFVLSGEDHSPE